MDSDGCSKEKMEKILRIDGMNARGNSRHKDLKKVGKAERPSITGRSVLRPRLV